MNSLFSKCFPLSGKTFTNVFKHNSIRQFSTSAINPLANLNCSFVTSAEVGYRKIKYFIIIILTL